MATNKKGQPAKKTKSIGKTVVSKKPVAKTSAKKTTTKVPKKATKSISKSIAKKAVKKALNSKTTAAKKVVKSVAKDIAKKSSTQKLSGKKPIEKKNGIAKKNLAKNVSVKKEKRVSKISEKVVSKKSVNGAKNDIANIESSLKKDKKNVTKDLAKTKKVSKIDTLSADHNNKNKTMQKKITETLPTKKSEPQNKYTADKKEIESKSIVSNVVEKEKQDKNEALKISIKPSISADNVLLEVVDPGFLTNDDVFDEADHAQWQQLREQADIQSRAMQLNRPETHPDFNGSECVECGIEIPLARLKMHKVRCVDCQNELEQERARTQRSTYTSKSSTNGWDD